jgi:hypothetical protein
MAQPFEMQRRAAAHYRRCARAVLLGGRNEWAIDAYAWDHDAGIVMTPIERSLWHDIRAADLVLYPQWPVAGFFVDFGNPVAKVAIECDGKAFHDPARDAKRQRLIEAEGWTVYRFTGRDCMGECLVDEEDEDTGGTRTRYSETFQRIREIGQRHQIARSTQGSKEMVHICDAIHSALRSVQT